MKRCEIYRFIERDFWFQQAAARNNRMSESEIQQMIDRMNRRWSDLTFKFYEDGTLHIIDNNTNNPVHPRDLTGASLDFYIRKRIDFIKSNLQQKIVKYA